MTKKDYIAIAAILRHEHQWLDKDANQDPRKILHIVAVKLSDLFEKDNPRFDRDRFMKAAISGLWNPYSGGTK